MGNKHSIVRTAVDWPLSIAARALIRLYQLVASRFLGRVCLFSPSCSRRALALFREYGFFDGLIRVRKQLQRCQGDYSLRSSGDGRVELITSSGEVIPHDEINPRIRDRLSMDISSFAAVESSVNVLHRG